MELNHKIWSKLFMIGSNIAANEAKYVGNEQMLATGTVITVVVLNA